MSARAPNPFRALGLTTEVLRRVRGEEEIRVLVTAQYRALSRIFHPDVGGSEAKFREISLAKETLEDPAQFAEYLAEYLRPRNERLAILEQELAGQAVQMNRLRVSYEQFLFEMGISGGFPYRNVRAIVDDTLKNIARRESYRQVGRVVDPPSVTFEIRLQEGLCSVRSVSFARKGASDLPEGVFLKDDVIVDSRGRDNRTLRAYEPKNEWKDPGYSVIGTVNLPSISDYEASRASRIALVGTVGQSSFGTFGFEQLFDYADEFSPEIREGTYIVALSHKDRTLRLAGKVLFIATRPI